MTRRERLSWAATCLYHGTIGYYPILRSDWPTRRAWLLAVLFHTGRAIIG